MLSWITELPTDKKIAGVHCVPVLPDGNIIMVWDRDEQGLTTIGGRLEADETLEAGLDREVMEEAGLLLAAERIPFAAWYWESTDTYTVWLLAKVDKRIQMPEGFEKAGCVIMNFETAIQMIMRLEGMGERVEIIRRAGMLANKLHIHDDAY